MKAYLGDSVYVEFDGYDFVLTTENGLGASNRIVLEPVVYRNLVQFKENLEKIGEETKVSEKNQI